MPSWSNVRRIGIVLGSMLAGASLPVLACTALVSVDGLTGGSVTVPRDEEAGAVDASADTDAPSPEGAAPDGGVRPSRIYVYGGSEDGLTIPDDPIGFYAEIGDGGDLGPWLPASPLPRSLIWQSCAVDGALAVLVGGLAKNVGGSRQVFVGSVADGRVTSFWSSPPVLPVGTSHAVSVLRGTDLFVLGGFGEEVGADVVRLSIGASSSGPAEVIAALPAPRARSGAAQLDDKLYMAGGSNADGSTTDEVVVATFAGRDVTFRNERVMPTKRVYPAAAIARGTLLVIGGDTDGKDVASVLSSRVTTGGLEAFRETTPLPFARSRHRAVAHDDHVYVIGGRIDAPSGGGSDRDVFVGDVAVDGSIPAWRMTTPLPRTARYTTVFVL